VHSPDFSLQKTKAAVQRRTPNRGALLWTAAISRRFCFSQSALSTEPDYKNKSGGIAPHSKSRRLPLDCGDFSPLLFLAFLWTVALSRRFCFSQSALSTEPDYKNKSGGIAPHSKSRRIPLDCGAFPPLLFLAISTR